MRKSVYLNHSTFRNVRLAYVSNFSLHCHPYISNRPSYVSPLSLLTSLIHLRRHLCRYLS